MTSINSNSGAMVALQMLGGTTDQYQNVQNEVATGKEVNTAKDNAAIWAISKMMEADVSVMETTSTSLNIGEATVAVAAVGAERIADIMNDMKSLAITASSGVVDYSKIEKQMAQKTEQINSIISGSQFNGVNLLATDTDGNGGTSLSIPAGPDLSLIEVDSVDFEGSALFDIGNRTAITDQASAQAALGEISGFLRFAIDGAAALGGSARQIAAQNDAVGKISDATQRGISAMIDTNMEEASARLTALSVQKQLGAVTLSIANYSPQSLGVLY